MEIGHVGLRFAGAGEDFPSFGLGQRARLRQNDKSGVEEEIRHSDTGGMSYQVKSRRTVKLLASAAAAVLSLTPVVLSSRGASAAPGVVQGAVFMDFGADGDWNVTGTQSDYGIGGITLTAYDDSGACGTTTTSTTGAYSLSHTCATATVRVEATWDETDARLLGLKPSLKGAKNGSTVRFVGSTASTVDFALIRPSDYCGINPALAVSCFFNGSATNDLAAKKSIDRVLWTANGDGRGSANKIASRQETGAVWGIASSRKGDVYSAAVLRRHIGLGTGGLSQIYKTTAAGVTTPFLNLGTSFGTGAFDDASRGLGASTDPALDDLAFAQAGKVGIGDLDLNDSENRFYLTNLATREVMSADATTGALQSYGTPPITCNGGGVERVWGVASRSFTNASGSVDRLYSGVVCDAGSLDGAVYSRDINATTGAALTAWSLVVAIPQYQSSGGWSTVGVNWNPWNDSADQKSMIISDISFDADGSMTIGVMDRVGLQMSSYNYNSPANATRALVDYAPATGDTLRACLDGVGAYALESGGACGTNFGAAGTDHRGPGLGEFYFKDDWNGPTTPANAAGGHAEVSLGGTAILPGSNRAAVGVFDPNEWLTSGVRWFDQTNGTANQNYLLVGSAPVNLLNGNPASNAANVDAGGLGKASGIGDLELLCEQAPIEVGNRVWEDTNANGVQDATEPSIGGVVVDLYSPAGTKLGSATTAADGSYYFSSRDFAGLTKNTANFELRIEGNQAALSGYKTTAANNDATTNGDLRDSDGTLLSGTTNGATNTFATVAGSDHTHDFGFIPLYSLGNRVWMDANSNGLIDTGEMGVDGVSVSLLDNLGNVVATTTTAGGGYYRFDNLNAGDYSVRINAANFTTGGALASKTSTTPTVADANSDIDLDDNGIDPATAGDYLTAGVQSGPVTLGGTAEPTGETDKTTTAGNAVDNRSNLTVDFGFVAPVAPPTFSLGNRVWMDANSNGLIDTGEMCVDGVSVSLLDNLGNVVATTTTAGGGYYRFDNLNAGDYSVRINAANFTTGGALAGKTSTTPTVADPNSDTDQDDNGIDPATAGDYTVNGVKSANVTLGGTTEPTGETDKTATAGDAADNRSNLTVDFGFVAPVITTTTTTIPASPTLYSIGNRVWMDANSDGTIDPNEMGVNGVSVSLLDAAGNVVKTTTTANDGYYRFDDLTAGNYVVRINGSNFATGGSLNTKVSTTPVANDPNSDVDSDDNGNDPLDYTAGVNSGVVILGPGEPTNEGDLDATNPPGEAPNNRSNLTIDFGFTAPVVVTTTTTTTTTTTATTTTAAPTTTTTTTEVPTTTTEAPTTSSTEAPTTSSSTTSTTTAPSSSTPTSSSSSSSSTSTTSSTTSTVQIVIVPAVTATPVAQTPVTTPITAAPTTSSTAAPAPTITTTPTTTKPPTTTTTAAPRGAALSAVIWVDANQNGVQDPSEAVVPGAQLEVRNSKGVVIATVQTDEKGRYLVDGLTTGEYTVTVVGGVGPEFAFLSNKSVTINVLGESISNAEFRLTSAASIAFTGAGQTVAIPAALALSLLGVGMFVLTMRRRRTNSAN